MPAAHELATPDLDELLEALARGERQAPERIAVEIDRVRIAAEEALAKGGERIVGIETRSLVAPVVDHRCCSSQRITGGHATERGSTCSMWPRPGSSISSQGAPASSARRP